LEIFTFTQLDAAVKEAFDVAYDNIYAFHAAQISAEKSVENMPVILLHNLLSYSKYELIIYVISFLHKYFRE